MLAETEAYNISTSLRAVSALLFRLILINASIHIHIYMCVYILCDHYTYITHIYIIFLKEFSHLDL